MQNLLILPRRLQIIGQILRVEELLKILQRRLWLFFIKFLIRDKVGGKVGKAVSNIPHGVQNKKVPALLPGLLR
jgi:hypothetical protein